MRCFIGLYPVLISNLGDIKPEARLWNQSQSVNFSFGSEKFLILTWSSMWSIIGKWSESTISEMVTTDCLIFWWPQGPVCHHFPKVTWRICNALFRNELFAFNCLPRWFYLCSVRVQWCPHHSRDDIEIYRQLQVVLSTWFPTGMQTLVASTETRGEGRSTWLWGYAFSNSYGSCTFSARVAVNSISVVIWKKKTSNEVSDVFLKTGPHLYIRLVAVYWGHGAASQCHPH
jgi:hypothetical protein